MLLTAPLLMANAPAPRPDYDENYDGIEVSNVEFVKQEDYCYSYNVTFNNKGDKFVSPQEDIYVKSNSNYNYRFDLHTFQLVPPHSEVTIAGDIYVHKDEVVEVIPENFIFRSLVTNDGEFTDFTITDVGINKYEGDDYQTPSSYVWFTVIFEASSDIYGYIAKIDYDGEDRYYMIRYGSSGEGEHHFSFVCEYDFDISKMEIESLTPVGYSNHYHPLRNKWGNVIIGIIILGLAEIMIGGIVAICVVSHVKKKRRAR